MSTTLKHETLNEVASRILEDTAFIFSAPLPEGQQHQGEILEATLTFIGPLRGNMRLVSSTAFGVELAASMLGIEPGEAEAVENGRAAFGELLNIVGGALVAEWFGTARACHLGIPAVVQNTTTPSDPSICAISLLASERFRVDLEVRVEAA